MFKLLNPNDPAHFQHLSQMHNLRYRIFVDSLKWRDGLIACSQMEFDDFDHSNCRYLVRLNHEDRVDACTRLTVTCYPYLLGEAFSDYVEEIPVPHSINVVETSRFCVDNKSAPGNAAGLIMAAMLELGLKAGIERYISLSDARIKPVVHKYGWFASELGPRRQNGKTTCVALSYDVTEEYHAQVKQTLGVIGHLIANDSFNFPIPLYGHQKLEESSRAYLEVAH